MSKEVFRVAEPIDINPEPDAFERKTAKMIASHLKSNIEFVKRSSSTTPDIFATDLGQFWEIKNIKGNSANTIHNNLKNIDRQSENIIITLFRSKMRPEKAESEIRRHLLMATRIKRAILITKSGKLVVIKG